MRHVVFLFAGVALAVGLDAYLAHVRKVRGLLPALRIARRWDYAFAVVATLGAIGAAWLHGLLSWQFALMAGCTACGAYRVRTRRHDLAFARAFAQAFLDAERRRQQP